MRKRNRDLTEEFNKAKAELEALGYPIGNIKEVFFLPKSNLLDYGHCWRYKDRKNGGLYCKIGICRSLMRNCVPYDRMKAVLYHELLHTCEDNDTSHLHHLGLWHERAVEITEKLGIDMFTCDELFKFEHPDMPLLAQLKCPDCGMVYNFYRIGGDHITIRPDCPSCGNPNIYFLSTKNINKE